MEKIHFISYGDQIYRRAKDRIYKEAMNTNWFDTIKCYEKKDLPNDFVKEFDDLLLMDRGGGYWIWKFYIILNRLEEINDNDFLIYLDSGCTINLNGKERFYEYIEMIKNNKYKIIGQQLFHQERTWTIKEIFEAFNIPEDHEIATSHQILSGIIIMQKCDAVISIFKDCLEKIRKDHLLITDHYNSKQRVGFKENRHDQSFFSLACKIHGCIILPDETWSREGFNSPHMRKFPFLATRKRG